MRRHISEARTTGGTSEKSEKGKSPRPLGSTMAHYEHLRERKEDWLSKRSY